MMAVTVVKGAFQLKRGPARSIRLGLDGFNRGGVQ